MKQFKTLIAAGLAGAVILASAGCANGKPGTQPSDTAASGTETKASETATESTGSETEESTEAVISTHKVEGETLYRDGEATRYAGGARGNILSVVVITSGSYLHH